MTHHALLGLDERPVLAVHLVVEAAGVAQVVAVAVAPPQRSGRGAAVHALAPLCGHIAKRMVSFRGIHRKGNHLNSRYLTFNKEVHLKKFEAKLFSVCTKYSESFRLQTSLRINKGSNAKGNKANHSGEDRWQEEVSLGRTER